jgi:hypothetical protein
VFLFSEILEKLLWLAFQWTWNNAPCVEFPAIITAKEHAKNEGWTKLWIESYSQVAITAFSSDNIVSWSIRNKWNNCTLFTKVIHFKCSHIFREGNDCTYKLADYSHIKILVCGLIVLTSLGMSFLERDLDFQTIILPGTTIYKCSKILGTWSQT